MVFPLALRTFQVPCPIHVKLTSLLSAIRHLPLDSPALRRSLPRSGRAAEPWMRPLRALALRSGPQASFRCLPVRCSRRLRLGSPQISAAPPGRSTDLPEKAIFPHAENEDADRRDRPDVGEDEVTRRAIEPEQEDDQDRERTESSLLDPAHDEQEDKRTQRTPLVRPALVGNQGSESEAHRHAVSRVPSAAPGGPRRRRREDEALV